MARDYFQQRGWIPLTFLLIYCPVIQPFDLNAAIAQLSNLPGKFPISLAELKQLATPSLLQKIFQSKTLPHIDAQNSGDATKLLNILTKLKPSEGRFDMQLEELLSNAFQKRPRPTATTTVSPLPEITKSVKRGVVHPTTHMQPSLVTRHGIHQFSSKFQRRKSPFTHTHGMRSTTMAMTPENPTEGPPPFEHITDPNIRNHRLFISNLDDPDLLPPQKHRNNYENFTIIDQSEDLMMDESAFVPSESSTTGWIGVSPEDHDHSQGQGSEMDPEELIRLREPLKKLSEEESDETFAMNTENYFRPSPSDTTKPKFVDPGQEFFTSTLRAPKATSEQEKPPYKMPHFPPVKKSDRILHQKQNYNQEFLNNFVHHHQHSPPPASPYKFQNPNPHPPVRVINHHLPPMMPPPPGPPHGHGFNVHPFAHYNNHGIRNKFSPSEMMNRYTLINNSVEEQTEASDKNDSSWTSTFFLLGGLIATSAVLAFVLPSFLPAVAVGKDSSSSGDAASSGTTVTDTNELDFESNKNFWTEVKGLYSDLVSVANGDFNFHGGEVTTTTSRPDVAGSSERKIGQSEEFVNGKLLSFPANSFVNVNRSTYNGGLNNSFLKEWARVQLHLIDS